ncbi:hypothetical protein [Streptomyces ossamyceticus]|uniref:hypothetical protein n=1 Tax=Streptomyces ossamyceticus TaxID=249581 RepID=UPI0006E1B287|nr:hypothetical protein [Streptomyces ossamyceticus]
MAAKKRAEEPAEEEPSRAAGGCVLAVLGGGLVAVAFAVDEAAGVLLVVVAGAVALYRSARRKGTDLALPSPTVPPSRGDVYAGETSVIARVVRPAAGVTILHPERQEIGEEEVTEP